MAVQPPSVPRRTGWDRDDRGELQVGGVPQDPTPDMANRRTDTRPSVQRRPAWHMIATCPVRRNKKQAVRESRATMIPPWIDLTIGPIDYRSGG